MKSSDIAILKQYIEGIERKGDKKVKITCVDKTAGEEIYHIISSHGKTLSGGVIKALYNGTNFKDFTLKMDSEEHADTLADNLQSIVDGTDVYEPDVNPFTGEEQTSKTSNPYVLLYIAAAIVLVSIGVYVWKKRK